MKAGWFRDSSPVPALTTTSKGVLNMADTTLSTEEHIENRLYAAWRFAKARWDAALYDPETCAMICPKTRTRPFAPRRLMRWTPTCYILPRLFKRWRKSWASFGTKRFGTGTSQRKLPTCWRATRAALRSMRSTFGTRANDLSCSG
jgi:hypothetical protein